MLDWFINAFGKAADAVARGTRTIADEGRHAIMGGWFGSNFEPHPLRQSDKLGWTLPDRDKRDAPEPQAHEPAKPDRERGIDR